MALVTYSYIGEVTPPYTDPVTQQTIPTPPWQGPVQAEQWHAGGDMATLGTDLGATVEDGPTFSSEFPAGSVVITRPDGAKYLCEDRSWPTIWSNQGFSVWTSVQFSSMYGA